MVPPQAAGPAKAGITGKNQTAAPGAKAARGGGGNIGNALRARPGGQAVPAKGGATGPR
jgi:hypothetical protein